MKLCHPSLVNRMGLFLGMKVSKADVFAVYRNSSAPQAAEGVEAHAFESRLVMAPFASVETVLGVCGLSKIAQPVVRAVTIYVVDQLCRPLSMCNEPCESVRQVRPIVNTDGNVSVCHTNAARLVSAPAVPSRAHIVSRFLGEKAALWIVVKNTASKFCSDVVAHFHLPKMSHICCGVNSGEV